MIRNWAVCLACLAAVAVGAAALYAAAGQEKSPPAAGKAAAPDDAASEPAGVAAVREANRAFARAFGRHDAKAVAALWTKGGEYDGPDGEPLRGRAAIEAAYGRLFKDNPKATLEAKVESVRLLGPRAAVEEGTLLSGASGKREAGGNRFSAFLVLEEGGWRFASVREWEPEEAERITLDDVAWLEGEWAAKGKDGEVRLSYARDPSKAFLRGRYTRSQEGKVDTSGTQVIGRDPNGGLRSWQFEDDGGFGEWAWSRDGNRWVIEATGTLPDGDEVTARHLLVPIDKDSFTWQVLERTVGGEAQPGRPPVKVTRVKGGK
jgi:uncharacterized protein (TIGR02246 family)